LVGDYNFYRVKVLDLVFESLVELHKIYDKFLQINLKCFPLLLALYLRSIYNEQVKGEQLRFATSIDSLVLN
jgi:hypothetical protein